VLLASAVLWLRDWERSRVQFPVEPSIDVLTLDSFLHPLAGV
jgi:hypothetical protein